MKEAMRVMERLLCFSLSFPSFCSSLRVPSELALFHAPFSSCRFPLLHLACSSLSFPLFMPMSQSCSFCHLSLLLFLFIPCHVNSPSFFLSICHGTRLCLWRHLVPLASLTSLPNLLSPYPQSPSFLNLYGQFKR